MNANEKIQPLHGPIIELNSGNYLSFENPDPTVIDINVIAGPLSRLCRFSGQINQFYSVAQHSVLVSYLVPREHRMAALLHDATEAFMAALLHDATEAFMADMPKPLKMLVPEYSAIEERMWAAVAGAFNLPLELPECVHIADKRMVMAEARDLLNTDRWKTWYPLLEAPEGLVIPLNPRDSEDLFLQHFGKYALERERMEATDVTAAA